MKTHPLMGVIIILVGLSMIGGFHVFNLITAIIVIWVGIKLLTGKSPHIFHSTTTETHEDTVKRFLVFSGINKKIVSSNFEGAEIGVVFGNAYFDFSEAKTDNKEVEMNLLAVFGGVKIKVPDDWTIKTEGAGIIGTFENNTKETKGSVTVNAKGAAIFGAVEIIN